MSTLTESFRLADIDSSAFAPRKSAAAIAAISTTDSLANLRADDLFAFLDVDSAAGSPVFEMVARIAQSLRHPTHPTRTAAEELEEERLNALTHGLGFAISAVGVAYLLSTAVMAGGWLRLASCGVYGASLLLMYAASTSLHATRQPALKRHFQLCDHVSIYLLIAGTYTPFLASLLQGFIGFGLLVCVWALAAIGIAIKLKYASRLADTSCLPCLGLGWLVLVAIHPLQQVLPPEGMTLLVAGGLSYSLGVIFFCRGDQPYFHAIWHLFVMAGTAFHFTAILFYIGAPGIG